MSTNRPQFTARRSRKHAPGVTIMELVVTLAVAALLVGGLASAVRLATLSLEGSTGATATSLSTGEAMDQLNANLRMATKFTERTSTAATFTVPDRTGDGLPETIRYAWTGAGAPLTRTINGTPTPAAVLLNNVQALNLTYLTRTVAPIIQESAEQVLSSFTGAYSTQLGINKKDWYAESFKPTLPANALFWKISSAEMMLSRSQSSGTILVELYATDALNKPTGPALSGATIDIATLSTTPTWEAIPLSPLTNIDPATGIALVVSSTNNKVEAKVAAKTSIAPPTANMYYSNSTNQGTSWPLPIGTTALEYRIYGTITTANP